MYTCHTAHVHDCVFNHKCSTSVVIFLCQNSTLVFSVYAWTDFLHVNDPFFPVGPLRFTELSPRCIDVLEVDPFVLVCRA